MGDGGDSIGKVLRKQGVEHLFTLCGGHIAPILVGAKRNGIRVIDTRQEPTAVFAADATSRLTGTPGVAAVTAGPGVTNSITAVKNAQMAQSPVVLLGGAVPTLLRGRGALQDIEQLKLFETVVKWAVRIEQDCDLVPVIEEAFDVSRSGVPGPVFVECPIDTLYDETLVRELYKGAMTGGGKGIGSKVVSWYVRRHVDHLFACSGRRAEPGDAPGEGLAKVKERDVRAVAGCIGTSRKPVLLVGSQAMLHVADTGALAGAISRLGVPAYLSGMARGLLGKEHPLLCRHQRSKVLKEADLVILAGVPMDFRIGYGRAMSSHATVVCVRREADATERNRRPDLAIEDDPCTFLIALAGATRSPPEPWQDWIGHVKTLNDAREREMTAFAAREGPFINPVLLCRAIDAALPDDSIVVGDGGDFVATASYIVRPRAPLSWLDPGPYGTLGSGAGFALAAKLARPSAETWILYGDGAAGYGLIEFDTFVRHGVPVVAVVGNDGGWTQIWRDQAEILKDDVGTTLRRSDYHVVAEGLGAAGLVVAGRPALDAALGKAREIAATGRPVLVNALMERTEFRKGSISM
ncbi:MAG: thiamine pyrophosphate-binding protein [Candidatus Lokiarchaeota archaeon]|nr:thiamine pyrophosphate-binding protein [Candidatus Lokiarchaeota archaeon]